jgi:HPt (histidine-containing phosphotransfer) domain-containing protein
MNFTSNSRRHCHPELMLDNVGGDREIFLQLAEIYKHESVKIFGQMQIAADAQDFNELGRQSHSLKGTVGPLGADDLVKILIQIEDECNRKQCQCDANRLTSIRDELAHIGTELQSFIDSF